MRRLRIEDCGVCASHHLCILFSRIGSLRASRLSLLSLLLGVRPWNYALLRSRNSVIPGDASHCHDMSHGDVTGCMKPASFGVLEDFSSRPAGHLQRDG